jgi:hypothetical protein
MAQLSPEAQEVFWAFNEAASGKPDDWHYLPAIAAALRAAADQVVPESECDSPDQEDWIGQSAWAQCCCSKRHKLLTIAAELKAKE